MKLHYYRVCTFKNGKRMGDWIYISDRSDKAIERAKQDYPEHADLIMTCEEYDDVLKTRPDIERAYRNSCCIYF